MWLFVGEAFILSYYEFNPYYIAQEEGCFIYSIFLAFMSLGMIFYENYKYKLTINSINKGFTSDIKYDLKYLELIFIAFPFIWIAVIYANVGVIPLLMGKDISDTMYEINYGFIYGYGIYNCVSSLIVYRNFRQSKIKIFSVLWLVMLVSFIAIMCFDSKRLFLLLTVLAIFVYEQMTTKSYKINRVTIISGLFALLMYSGLQSIRTGNSDINKYSSQGLPLGVEFREYIRTVNHFKPGDIKNYDLLTSTIASMINSSVLKLAGYDKSELSHYDSANAWMKLFDDNNSLGIRTGLISEIYFAYDYYGLFIIALVGYFISFLCNALIRVQKFSNLILLSLIYGLTTLTVFGQLSVWAGCTTVLAYLYIMIHIYRFMFVKNFARPERTHYREDIVSVN